MVARSPHKKPLFFLWECPLRLKGPWAPNPKDLKQKDLAFRIPVSAFTGDAHGVASMACSGKEGAYPRRALHSGLKGLRV